LTSVATGSPTGLGPLRRLIIVVDKHAEAEGMRGKVPSTVARSDDKAVRTYKKTLESAEQTYGEGERARRAAMASLKHTHEKVGDHWEAKADKGPSDEQAAQSTRSGFVMRSGRSTPTLRATSMR
jgi:hypothetical protein